MTAALRGTENFNAISNCFIVNYKKFSISPPLFLYEIQSRFSRRRLYLKNSEPTTFLSLKGADRGSCSRSAFEIFHTYREKVPYSKTSTPCLGTPSVLKMHLQYRVRTLTRCNSQYLHDGSTAKNSRRQYSAVADKAQAKIGNKICSNLRLCKWVQLDFSTTQDNAPRYRISSKTERDSTGLFL